MAKLHDIAIEMMRRPCIVKGKKALWHKWSERAEAIGESLLKGGHPAGIIKATFAIVEFEDGTVAEVYPAQVKFADGGQFGDYAWRETSVEEHKMEGAE